MAVNFREKIGDIAPNSAGFSLEGGRAVYTYYVTSNEVIDAIDTILGRVDPDGSGGLKRALPAACPQYPWLTATRIESIQGIGYKDGDGNKAIQYPSTGELECPLISEYFWSYPHYSMQVEYTARPYAMLSDDAIGTESVVWYNDDGVAQPTIDVKREWLRWVEWDYSPASEFLTFQQGASRLVVDSSAISTAGGSPPHGFSFPGPQRIFVEKSRITLLWKAVPYAYIFHQNSYIRKWQGRVNQLDWLDFPKGSLLYVGYKARRYMPPLPKQNNDDGSVYTVLLCDIEFTFEYVARTSSSTITPSKNNWINGGHNLQPFAGDKKWYYAIFPPASTADLDTTSKWRPTFESCPFQLLFRDPTV